MKFAAILVISLSGFALAAPVQNVTPNTPDSDPKPDDSLVLRSITASELDARDPTTQSLDPAAIDQRSTTVNLGGPATAVDGNSQGGNAKGKGSGGESITLPFNIPKSITNIFGRETINIGGPAVAIGGHAQSGKASGGDININPPSISIPKIHI